VGTFDYYKVNWEQYMADNIRWGLDNAHPFSQMKTELIWEGNFSFITLSNNLTGQRHRVFILYGNDK
jgi:hypothetical protein